MIHVFALAIETLASIGLGACLVALVGIVMWALGHGRLS